MSVYDRPGVSQGHAVKLPILHALFNHPHHLARRHRGPGRNLARLFLPRRQHLDVRAPNVDDENFGSIRRWPILPHPCYHSSTSVWFFLLHRQANSKVGDQDHLKRGPLNEPLRFRRHRLPSECLIIWHCTFMERNHSWNPPKLASAAPSSSRQSSASASASTKALSSPPKLARMASCFAPPSSFPSKNTHRNARPNSCFPLPPAFPTTAAPAAKSNASASIPTPFPTARPSSPPRWTGSSSTPTSSSPPPIVLTPVFRGFGGCPMLCFALGTMPWRKPALTLP